MLLPVVKVGKVGTLLYRTLVVEYRNVLSSRILQNVYRLYLNV